MQEGKYRKYFCIFFRHSFLDTKLTKSLFNYITYSKTFVSLFMQYYESEIYKKFFSSMHHLNPIVHRLQNHMAIGDMIQVYTDQKIAFYSPT